MMSRSAPGVSPLPAGANPVVGVCASVAGALALAAGVAVAIPAGVSAQQPGERMVVEIPGTDQSIDFVWVPGGSFRMGSPMDEAGRDDDEGPVHGVIVAGFWMSAHEVTQAAYAPFRHREFDTDVSASPDAAFSADAVTRPSPPYEDPAHGMGGAGHPATGLTRYNALRFAQWLSRKTGRFVRLPSEAEWEYACRAGAAMDATHDLDTRAWFETNSEGTPHPVGERDPNAWGLFDMQGNVAEWVVDDFDAGAYAARVAADSGGTDAPAGSAGAAAETGSFATVALPELGDIVRGRGVVRGGAFDDPASRLRCAERLPEQRAWKRRDPQIPKSRWWNTDAPHIGFRIVIPGAPVDPSRAAAWFDSALGDPAASPRP